MPAVLQLLGPARLREGGRATELPVNQALLLAAFLACRADWVTRDEVLGLFWPEEDERKARHNLSQLLYFARRQRWLSGLEAERSRLRWPVDTDLHRLRDALKCGNWPTARSLYRGTLLEGVAVDEAANYHRWLEQERESLRRAWHQATMSHAQSLEQRGGHAEAAAVLLALLQQDEWAEDVLQAYLRAAERAGQREQALRTFEGFRERLERELGLTPLEATLSLAAALRSPGKSTDNLKGVRRANPGLKNAPNSLVPFVGRDLELAELAGLLEDETLRLLTLLGPGGVGKTRLALELARQQAERFPDGAVFVPLATLEEPALLATALATALGEPLEAGEPPERQVAAALVSRKLLLVLDNFEQLLDGVGLLLELLEQAPGLRLLVTSRSALDVRGEVIYDLRGLNYPASPDDLSLRAYDAVAFFVHAARRADARFALGPGNQADVLRLCRLLDGSPLGLELAASWVRLLTVAELGDDVEKNLSALAGNQRDLPARHRSLQAVLESSWALLREEEQAALARLSVFRGGFSPAAAGEVTGAKLRTLLTLVNKSLLSRRSDGRFERLMVVQQFCWHKLERDAELATAMRDRHARFFLNLAEDVREQLNGPEQAAGLERLSREHDNLRAALRWYLSSRQVALAQRLGTALMRFWWLRGHYQEGRRYLEKVLELGGNDELLRAKALNAAGSLARLCEDLPAAERYYRESLALRERLGDEEGVAGLLGNLGMLLRLQGDYGRASELVQRSAARFRALGETAQAANMLNNLAALAMEQEQPEEGERLNLESLQLAREAGDRFVEARSLGNLGILARQRRDYAQAQRYLTNSLSLLQALGYRAGIGILLQDLGELAREQGQVAEALSYFARSHEVMSELRDQRHKSELLLSLAALALDLHEPQDALELLAAAQVVRATCRIPFSPQLQSALAHSKQRAHAVLRLPESAALPLVSIETSEGLAQEVLARFGSRLPTGETEVPSSARASADRRN